MASLAQLIRHDVPLETGATAIYPYSEGLSRKYRFDSRFGDEVLLHAQDPYNPKLIHLPRGLCPVGMKDSRDPGEKVVFPKTPIPRPHQEKLFAEAAEFVLAGQSGICVAYTGWGKTVLGYYLAATLGVKTLVITTKDDIYQQWIKDAQQFLGLKPHEIGEIRGDKCEVMGTKFVVAMIHSLSKEGRYPSWIVKGFGLVIFDECHRVPADQFQAVAPMFPARIRVGMSATPERADGKEIVIKAHIGPIRCQTEAQLMIPKVLRYKTDWRCPRTLRTNKAGEKKVVRVPHQPGRTMGMEKIMAADPLRNHLMGQLVASAYEKKRKLVAFGSTHEHLHLMNKVMLDLGVPQKDMGYYIGASTKEEEMQQEWAKVKPIIWTTDRMMGEGTNIPWLDCCLLMMPRANVEQMVGRIRREYPEKPDPVVMDPVDNDSPVFQGYGMARMKWYTKIGATVKEMQ